MIKAVPVGNDTIKLEVKMHTPQSDLFTFLQMRGYEIKPFFFEVPATEEFLVIEPAFTVNTFTATKPDEKQGYDTLYLNVFEKEIKEFLKGL
jgi:hypothetical protein